MPKKPWLSASYQLTQKTMFVQSLKVSFTSKTNIDKQLNYACFYDDEFYGLFD